jgi:hypothetical protein
MKIIIISIIQYLSLRFILFRFYLENNKNKVLESHVQKGYPNCEYAQEIQSFTFKHISIIGLKYLI